MAYVVTKSDGTTLVTIADQTINSSASSLSLPGRGVYNYGLPIANDLVRMLENFAYSSAPSLPLTGQLWYDTTNSALKLWNGSAWVTTTSLNNRVVQYLTDTGSANAYVGTMSPAPSAYVAGMTCTMKIAHTNTGASTVNLNSLGTKSIVNSDGTAMVPGQLILNGLANLVYDGTNFVLMNPVSDTVNVKSVQNQANVYATATGSINTYAVTLSPAPTSYTAGMVVVAKIPVTNTSTSTLNVNSLGAKVILNTDGSLLSSGQLPAGGVCTFVYDGGHFQVVTTSTASKQRLNSNMTIYVSPSGNNANTGTFASPFKTIQYAYDYAVANIDLNGYTLVIQLADGTYTNPGGSAHIVTAVAVNAVGSGLTDGTRTFTVVGGTGTAAVFTAIVSGGSVIPGSIILLNNGSYSVDPSTTANACTVDTGTTNATFNLTIIASSQPILSINAVVTGLNGRNNVVLQGNPGSPTNVILSATSASCIVTFTGAVNLTGMRFLSSGTSTDYNPAGVALVSNGGFLGIGNVDFGSCDESHMSVFGGGVITTGGQPYSITNTGGTQPFSHIAVGVGGAVTTVLSTLTINSNSGTFPNFRFSFVNVSGTGIATLADMVFKNGDTNTTVSPAGTAGIATGKQAYANLNGIIQVNAAGVDYLPGTSHASDADTVMASNSPYSNLPYGGLYV